MLPSIADAARGIPQYRGSPVDSTIWWVVEIINCQNRLVIRHIRDTLNRCGNSVVSTSSHLSELRSHAFRLYCAAKLPTMLSSRKRCSGFEEQNKGLTRFVRTIGATNNVSWLERITKGNIHLLLWRIRRVSTI